MGSRFYQKGYQTGQVHKQPHPLSSASEGIDYEDAVVVYQPVGAAIGDAVEVVSGDPDSTAPKPSLNCKDVITSINKVYNFSQGLDMETMDYNTTNMTISRLSDGLVAVVHMDVDSFGSCNKSYISSQAGAANKSVQVCMCINQTV